MISTKPVVQPHWFHNINWKGLNERKPRADLDTKPKLSRLLNSSLIKYSADREITLKCHKVFKGLYGYVGMV